VKLYYFRGNYPPDSTSHQTWYVGHPPSRLTKPITAISLKQNAANSRLRVAQCQDKRGPGKKRAVVALVERGGKVRSFHPALADAGNVTKIVREYINRETRLHTDESKLYHRVGKEFAAHETVNHSIKEYARGDVTTNTVEGYFSIFKRGMRGIYQHCSEKPVRQSVPTLLSRATTRPAKAANNELGFPPLRRYSSARLSASAVEYAAYGGKSRGGADMADADIHWAQYIKAATEAFVLLKALYPLLPTQSKDEVETKIEAAERALEMANVALAKSWGFKIHDCAFPPKIMLWDNDKRVRRCPGCGYEIDPRPQRQDYEDEFLSVRR